MGQQPQWSADRQWWWDGANWVLAAQAPAEASAPAAIPIRLHQPVHLADAYVYQSGDGVPEVGVEGDQGGKQTVSNVYNGPGDHYLKVLSANTSWTITVEQTAS